MGKERGRPRSFDEDTVLDSALSVFWRSGFQSTSLTELTEATGLNKPSLYAAFGDKQALYLKSLERYLTHEIATRAEVLDREPDARVAVEEFLRSMAALLTDPTRPGGCFIVNGTADFGIAAMPPAIDTALRAALRTGEQKLRACLQRAQRRGEWSAPQKAANLAGVFATLLAGLAVMAKSGAKRAQLNAIIDTAITIWPK